MSTDTDQSTPAPEAPTSRLMITHMELENFKSYMGVQTIGPFHSNFSSVVGPNGSGKSNVIDAMLFVFGYKAKRLRQAKLSDLIHKSDGFQNLPFCRVTVFFQSVIDTDSGFDVVEDSQIKLSRVAFAPTGDRKTGDSQYRLNDKVSTYGEVTQLLRGRGIDLDHNRFLILQGEVESIAMMKPKAPTEHEDGLLEYLQDIIGTHVYKEQIEEKAVALEELNDQRSEKLNRVRAVESEKETLEGSKKEAEEFLRLENDLTRHRSTMLQSSVHTATARLEETRALKQAKDEELAAEQSKHQTAKDEVKNLEQATKKGMSEADKIAAAVEDTKKANAEFARKDVKCRSDLKHAKATRAKTEAALEKERVIINKLTQTMNDVTTSQERREKEKLSLQNQLAQEEEQLEQICDSLKGETAPLQAKLEEVQQKQAPAKRDVNAAESALQLASSELEVIRSKALQCAAKVEAARTELAKCAEKMTAGEANVTRFAQKHATAKEDLEKAVAELKEARALEPALVERVRVARSAVEEGRTLMQAARSTSAVLDSLKQLAKQGKVRGMHGRLGDLGLINDKYDVAVSTACSALNHIVVDTTEDAQICLEHLKRTGTGRATFIILNQLDAGFVKRSRVPFDAPEAGVSRLFDLVTHDETFRAAFYFALRDTLVAKDLEQATRIAFAGARRQRVVTLTGQLIDASGTMAGGGSKVSRGGMKLMSMSAAVRQGKSGKGGAAALESETVTPSDLKRLEAEACAAASELHALRKRIESLVQRVDSLQRAADVAATSVDKAKVGVQSATQQHADLNKALAQLEVESASGLSAADDKRATELEEQLTVHTKALQAAQQEASRFDAEIKTVQEQIMSVGGVRLRAQKSKVDLLKEKLELETKEHTRGAVEFKTAQRNLQKAQTKVTLLEQELEKVSQNIGAYKTELDELVDKAIKANDACTEASELMKAKSQAVVALREQLEASKKAFEAARTKEVDLANEVERLATTIKDCEGRLRQCAKELAGLELHELEDDNEEEEEDNEEEEEEDKDQDEMDESEEGESQKKTKKKTAKGLPMVTAEEAKRLKHEDIKYQMTLIEEKIKSMRPNVGAIKEYRKKEEEYLTRVAELDAVTAERDTLRGEHETLIKTRLNEFMSGFSAITLKLKEMYQMITLGGDAELELVDSHDPFSEGIVFSVRPHKKTWKNISNLSGGEKTLASLALVFALHHFKPTPLYVMDEIDAALDFKNVSIVANYIKERTKNAQFIIISLRSNMFELADRLIGIYKTDNCTKTVTINPQLVAQNALPIEA